MANNLKISIDVLLTGAERIQKLANALNGLRSAASGANTVSQATRNLSTEQERAERNTLRLAQAMARLQTAQGNTAQAVNTLRTALAGVNQQSLAAISAQTQLARVQNASSWTRYAGTIREAGESIQQAGYFLAGLSTALIGVGAASVKSAFDIDRNINTLKALLGSATAAEARFKELTAISQGTPGLTTSLAAQLDVQLRVANATEQAINKVLPAIGKLNAVARLQDPQRFVQNLVQLVTQNFERIDLKELVGQSPLAGEIIKQIFSVDSAIDGEAIRESAQKLGLTTVDAFFTAFGQAAARNPKLANITESLETQFAKIVDRVTIALRPLGVAIIEALAPLVETAARIVERLSATFTALPSSVQQAILVFGALATAIAPATIAIGAFVQSFGALLGLKTALSAIFGAGGALASLGGFAAALAPAAPIILGIAAALGVAGLAWANYESAADKGAKVTESTVKSQLSQVAALKEVERQATALATGQGKLNDVLNQLEPSTRAYISSIADEQTRTIELNRVLREQIALKEKKLATDIADTGAAAARVQGEIEQQTRLLNALKELSAESAKLQQQGVAGSNLAAQLGALGNARFGSSIGQSIERGLTDALLKGRTAAEFFGQSITDVTQKLGGLDNAQAQLGASVDALFQANRTLTIDGFIAQQRAVGTAEDQIRAAVSAYEAFKQQQLAAVPAVSNATAAIDAQANAIKNLKDAARNFNLQGLGQGIGELKDTVIKEAVKTGKSVNSILDTLQKTKPEAKEAITLFRKLTAASRAYDEAILPPTRSRAARSPRATVPSSAPSQSLLNERQQLEESLLQIRKAFAERGQQFERLAADQAEKELEAQLDRREIGLEDYYKRKAQLIEADGKREATAIKRVILEESARLDLIAEREAEGIAAAQKRESDLLAQTKNKAERQKIQLAALAEQEKVSLDAATARNNLTREIIRLETDLGLVQRRNAAAAKENAAAQVAALRQIRQAVAILPKSIVESTQKGFDKVIEEFLRQASEARDLLKLQLDNEAQAIQNKVAAGLLSERAARDAILALEQEKRQVLLDQLKISEQNASKIAEPAVRAQRQAEIQRVKLQTEAIGINPLFREIRSGLQNDLAGAFNEFIANARFNLEGLKNFATGVIDSFRRAIAKALSDKIEKTIVQPITNAFLEKVLGIKTIDPVTVANTGATVANTAALNANTSAQLAKSGQSIADQVSSAGSFEIRTPSTAGGGETASGAIEQTLNKTQNLFQRFANSLKGIVTNIGGGLRSILSGLASFFGNIFGSLFGGLGGGGQKFSSLPKEVFAEGGYTGDGAKYQPAGIVHAGEYVVPANRVSQWGAGFFEAIRRGSFSPAMLGDYLSGLSNISVRARSGAFASGGLATVAPVASGVTAQPTALRIVNVNNPAQAAEFLNSAAGEQVILNRISKSPAKWRAALKL